MPSPIAPDPPSIAAASSEVERGAGESGWRVLPRAGWRLGAMAVMIAYSAAEYLRPSSRRTLRGRAEWLQRACRRCLRVLHVTVDASTPVPTGVYLTPNHVGYMDILVLASLTPVVFVSKHEVGAWPVFGWFARRCGTRFLRRAERKDLVRVGAELAPVLEAGVNLTVFLEGTSSDGRAVLPFKPSLLAPAVAEGWMVVPVALQFATAPGLDPTQRIAWWGDMTLPPHLVGFAALPWVQATVQWGPPMRAEGDRKVLAARLQAEVERMLLAGAAAPGSI